MRCPLDHQPLEPSFIGGLSGHACGQCRGLWLPGASVRQLAGTHGIVLPTPGQLGSRHGRRTSQRIVCPVDRVGAHIHRFRGVEIDICSHCGGIWLDGGELDAIIQSREPGTFADGAVDVAVQAPDLVYYAGKGIARAGETVVEFLIEALSAF